MISYFLQRCLAIALGLLLGLTAQFSYGQVPEIDADLNLRREVINRTRKAFAAKDPTYLTSTYVEYRVSQGRTQEGALKLTWLDDAIANAIRGDSHAPSEATLKKSLEIAQSWVAAEPKNILLQLILAKVQMLLALQYRGSFSSPPSSESAARQFDAWLLETQQTLLGAEILGREDPSWYRQMIELGIRMAWTQERIDQLLEDSMKVNLMDYRPYLEALNYFSPRQFGDIEKIDRLIKRISSAAGGVAGEILYVRLYDHVARRIFTHRIYSHTLVDWGKMKGGLDLLLQRSKSAWVINTYAYHSCIAEDKEKFKSILALKEWQLDIYLWNPNGVTTFGRCRNWAAQA